MKKQQKMIEDALGMLNRRLSFLEEKVKSFELFQKDSNSKIEAIEELIWQFLIKNPGTSPSPGT